jgi:hypothetical protein
MAQLNRLVRSIMLVLLGPPLFSQSTSTWKDPSPHVTRFITVDQGVKLEVLDWGGSGRPLVLLAGGGNTAHVFDDFAPKLIATTMFTVLRDADSVLPVIRTLRIQRTAWATTWWQ